MPDTLNGFNIKTCECPHVLRQGPLPSMLSRPKTEERKMPMVMESWATVPKAPRKLKGAISVRYMGATQLPIPGDTKGYLRGRSLSGTWGPRSYQYLVM